MKRSTDTYKKKAMKKCRVGAWENPDDDDEETPIESKNRLKTLNASKARHCPPSCGFNKPCLPKGKAKIVPPPERKKPGPKKTEFYVEPILALNPKQKIRAYDLIYDTDDSLHDRLVARGIILAENEELVDKELDPKEQSVLKNLGSNLVTSLNLSRSETKKMIPILEECEQVLQDHIPGIQLVQSENQIYQNIRIKLDQLKSDSGLRWQMKKVTLRKEEMYKLIVFYDLKVFLPWLLSLKYWRDLFDGIPKDTLIVALYCDGWPTYRWAQQSENGYFNITIKIVHNPLINESIHNAIPIFSYHGPEQYEFMEALISDFLASLNDFTFQLGERTIKVVFVGTSDMSARSKIYQIGTPGGDYPLSTLPLHKDQQGDVWLNPTKLASRFDEQKQLLAAYPSGKAPKGVDLFGITLRKNLAAHDPCLDMGGPGHMHKNTCLRFCFCLLKISYHFGTQDPLSRALFHRLITIEDFETGSAPQFTGLESNPVSSFVYGLGNQCRDFARNFESMLRSIGGTSEIRNTLRCLKAVFDEIGKLLLKKID